MNISSAAVIEGACTLGASKSKRSPASRTACAVVEPNVPILISFCSKSGKFFFKEDTPAGLKNTSMAAEKGEEAAADELIARASADMKERAAKSLEDIKTAKQKIKDLEGAAQLLERLAAETGKA